MRHAIVLLVASSAVGCYGSGSVPEDLPVAPPSALTVAAPTGTISGSAVAVQIRNTSDCPPAFGIGLRASASGAVVTAVFPRFPEEGAVYDLSAPGTSDYVIISAVADGHVYCVPEASAAGSVVVNRSEEAGARWLADVTLTGVTAGATTIDAHLYH